MGCGIRRVRADAPAPRNALDRSETPPYNSGQEGALQLPETSHPTNRRKRVYVSASTSEDPPASTFKARERTGGVGAHVIRAASAVRKKKKRNSCKGIVVEADAVLSANRVRTASPQERGRETLSSVLKAVGGEVLKRERRGKTV